MAPCKSTDDAAPGERPLADIFISYARSDREKIEKLASALEAEGYSIWWDRNIVGGKQFSEEIERELNAAKAVIVAWSAQAIASPWVKDEAAAARDQEKMIPIHLDDEQAPMGFRQYHAVHLEGWQSVADAPAFSYLLRAIATLAGKGEHPASLPTPENRRMAQRLSMRSVAIFATAAIAIGGPIAWFAVGDDPPKHAEAVLNETPRIAVAPFNAYGDDPQLATVARSLAEDIASGLSRFSYLLVAAAPSPAGGANERYSLAGSLRRENGAMRLAVQLIDLRNGERVWAETYDRELEDGDLFEIHDDLTDHVVAAVADPYGSVARDLIAGVEAKDADHLTSYETLLLFVVFANRVTVDDHLNARNALERAIEREPGNAALYAYLALIYLEEHKQGFNALPDPTGRALRAAQQAVDLDTDNAAANHSLAQAYFYNRNIGGFATAAEHAIALNPRDSDIIADTAIAYALIGDWGRAVQHARRAMSLNPNHPGWYWMPLFLDAYNQGDDLAALGYAERMRTHGFWRDAWARAMSLGQLGRTDEASAALRDMIDAYPGDLSRFEKDAHEPVFFAQPALHERVSEGLRKAGFDASAPAGHRFSKEEGEK